MGPRRNLGGFDIARLDDADGGGVFRARRSEPPVGNGVVRPGGAMASLGMFRAFSR